MSISSIQGLGQTQAMGAMQGMGRGPKPQPLSDEQKTTLQEILSEYDPASVSSEDAKEFFTQIREAGIRGPEVREAVEAAGFDADALFEMAHGDRQPPQRAQSNQQINLTSLQTLQQILNQFDLNALEEDDQNNLMSQLTQAGLTRSGSVLDIGV